MREVDILVVGSGPGGMSAAQYASRAGYSTLVLDPMGPGGQLLYIDEIENYPGLGKISGYFLSESMENQCKEFGVEIEYDEVKKIEKKNAVQSFGDCSNAVPEPPEAVHSTLKEV